LSFRTHRRLRSAWAAAVLLAAVSAAGCRQDMHDQPRFEPLEKTVFFEDQRSARPQVPGTVARGELREDEHFYRGLVNGELAPEFPMPVTKELILRGRERYEIFCTPCHGAVGDGEGMIVQRGFRHPPSYHIERLRAAPPGHFFDVITNGLGAMSDFADRIPPRDRWAIVAYIRALQLSQHAELAQLPQQIQQESRQAIEP